MHRVVVISLHIFASLLFRSRSWKKEVTATRCVVFSCYRIVFFSRVLTPYHRTFASKEQKRKYDGAYWIWFFFLVTYYELKKVSFNCPFLSFCLFLMQILSIFSNSLPLFIKYASSNKGPLQYDKVLQFDMRFLFKTTTKSQVHHWFQQRQIKSIYIQIWELLINWTGIKYCTQQLSYL